MADLMALAAHSVGNRPTRVLARTLATVALLRLSPLELPSTTCRSAAYRRCRRCGRYPPAGRGRRQPSCPAPKSSPPGRCTGETLRIDCYADWAASAGRRAAPPRFLRRPVSGLSSTITFLRLQASCVVTRAFLRARGAWPQPFSPCAFWPQASSTPGLLAASSWLCGHRHSWLGGRPEWSQSAAALRA
jgi:hypothetical protein